MGRLSPVGPRSTATRRPAGVRRLFDLVAADARVEATAIQTVGGKGWDGFALALVTVAPT